MEWIREGINNGARIVSYHLLAFLFGYCIVLFYFLVLSFSFSVFLLECFSLDCFGIALDCFRFVFSFSALVACCLLCVGFLSICAGSSRY